MSHGDDAIPSKLSLFEQASEAAVAYLAAERDGAVHRSSPTAIAETLDKASLDQPMAASDVIELLAELGSKHAVRTTGGRYFGFVTGGTDATALSASTLATAWDQNAALPAMSPLAAAVDRQACEQLKDLLDLPSSATAAFCAGASVANLTAIITARDALLQSVGWDVNRQGLGGAPEFHVVISDEAHVSVDKALRLAGIGTDAVTRAPVDQCGRIDPALLGLPEVLTLLVCQAGNVNTGHSDPFEEIMARVGPERRMSAAAGGAGAPTDGPGPVWVHVDGAFGLWAAASPRHRHEVAGVDQADSWATDCHKWLNVPYDSGLVAVARGSHLARSMAADAAYLDGVDDNRAPMHLGLQMSQAARAIPVWAMLAANGRQGIADIVDRCCRLSQRFAAKVEAAGARVLAPVVLNQVLVRFDDDAVTDAVIATTAAGGRCWMGGTTWQGRRAMRVSVSDVATTEADIDIAAEAVIASWHEVRSA